jgi:hypothetical protein
MPPPVVAGQPAPPVSDAPLPAFTASDLTVRGELSGLSPREQLQRWLDTDHLLERLVVVTDNLASDQSPAQQLELLRPARPFSASRKGSRLIISERSQARYDAFANVIGSLDDRCAAKAYKALHPLLTSAYHALGYPGRSFDAAVTQALQRIVDAPVRDEAAVELRGSHYVFADTALESLGPVEKQLLRMGSRNTRLLQSEARELATALGLQLRSAPQATH